MLNDYQKGKVGKTKENCNYYKDPNSPDFKGKKRKPKSPDLYHKFQ
jgi:hypothetical protein